MEYTEPKTYTQSENLNEPKCKTLEQLILFLESEVIKLDIYSLRINEKLQKIEEYSEDTVSDKECNPEFESDSFKTKLEQLINKLSEYNDRIGFSVRHLDTLI